MCVPELSLQERGRGRLQMPGIETEASLPKISMQAGKILAEDYYLLNYENVRCQSIIGGV